MRDTCISAAELEIPNIFIVLDATRAAHVTCNSTDGNVHALENGFLTCPQTIIDEMKSHNVGIVRTHDVLGFSGFFMVI